MSLYGIALMLLADRMHQVILQALQPWYANNAAAAGEACWNVACMNYLVRFGPRYGYFMEPAKSHYICKAEDEEVAREAFATLNLEINFSRGRRYLGGFFGSEATWEQWIGDLVAKWTMAVESCC